MSRAEALAQLGGAFKAALAAMRRLHARESSGELTNAQYGLLFGLQECSELSTGELAFSANLSPAAATEMLEGLAAAGLVERRRSERDRRVVLVSLTEHGRTLVEERRAMFEPLWRAAFSDFSEDELQTAIAVLDRVRAFFDERSAEADSPVEVRRPLARAAHAEADSR